MTSTSGIQQHHHTCSTSLRLRSDKQHIEFIGHRTQIAGFKKCGMEQLRQKWRNLYALDLPAMAKAKDEKQKWPVHLDHCFARIILDNTRPAREQSEMQ